MNDEIITELHATKDKLAAQFGYDLRKLIDDVRRTEADNAKQGRALILVQQEKRPVSQYQQTRFAQH